MRTFNDMNSNSMSSLSRALLMSVLLWAVNSPTLRKPNKANRYAT